MNLEKFSQDIAVLSKEASYKIAKLNTKEKNDVLILLMYYIRENKNNILQANKIDIDNINKNIKDENDKDRIDTIIDRLILDDKKIEDIINAVEKVITLNDSVGSYVSMVEREDGLIIGRMRCPIGVIMMIYEARPNVTIDAFCLCFKSSNAVILRGGKECINTNIAFAKCIEHALASKNLDKNICTVIDNPDRQLMAYLLKENKSIDMVIPRGGEALINYVLENSSIPVVCHDRGVCHLYIESDASLNMAVDIAVNSKAHRTSVCNATECILFHKDFKYIKEVCEALVDNDIELRVCNKLYSKLAKNEKIIGANENDYGHEFLSKIVAMKIVDDFDMAATHINKYGSHHTDSIVTDSFSIAQKFKKEIDSAVVMVNASTRLSDGGEFGLGAEIGISNQKLHSRGPMGLDDLTSIKYVVVGNGHIRK